jgi:hypothetical protein
MAHKGDKNKNEENLRIMHEGVANRGRTNNNKKKRTCVSCTRSLRIRGASARCTNAEVRTGVKRDLLCK